MLLHEELLHDGWNFTSLTEDRELCAHAVADGERISFQYDAVFYDEQPTDLKIAFRQRIRWSKGHIVTFFREGWRLARGIFKAKGLQKFICYDMLCVIFPRDLFSTGLAALLAVFTLLNTWNPLMFGAALAGLLLGSWGSSILLAAYTLIMEHKRLPNMKWYRILWFILTFPIFGIIGKITTWIALFSKVEWKPIPHVSDTKIEEMAEK